MTTATYIPRGVREASNILSKSDKILLYADPDIDGVTAYQLVRKVLITYNKSFQIYINENRQHGFKMTHEQVEQLMGYTVILVDAGMTREELVYLTKNGVNIINIDHHHLPYDELVHVIDPITQCEGVIINNQYPFEPEDMRFLSGAGVVYYTFKAMFPEVYTYDEVALVGLSLLSDIRVLDSPLAKRFLQVTYNHQSEYIDYLINLAKPERDYGFGKILFDRNFIDFTFSPKINALFRLNKGYDAIRIFEGSYINQGDLDVYRGIQKAITSVILENLQGEELSNLTFKYVDSNLPLPYDYDITNFIGLACSQVSNGGKTTVLFVREDGKVKRGSLRGISDDVDYLSILRRHGFKADGHPNAFGIIEVDLANIDLEALNREIAYHEQGYEQRKYEGRLLPVENLSFFLSSKADGVADHNNYTRDNQRIFVRYTGKNISRMDFGKVTKFQVDGVEVLCFDPNLTIETGLILPVKERGKYIKFYLQPY